MSALGRWLRLVLLVLLAWGVAAPPLALAQGGQVAASTTAPPRAEVGQPFVVELHVTSDEGPMRAEDPSLTPPIGVAASSPSVSFFSNTTTVNGVRRSTSEYRARWTLKARDAGSYNIEAPSVTIRGKRIRGNPVRVEVVPPGQGGGPPVNPAPGVQFQFSWPFGQSGAVDDEPADDPEASRNLALPAAPAGKEYLFLRAITDTTTAVVGQQVTLSFYLYIRGGDVEWTDKTEPSLADFLRMPLVRDPGLTGSSLTTVGGRRWSVKLLDRVAIFPLRSGDLPTGAMGARFKGRRIGSRVLETSNDVIIKVTEPPTAGRPPGYVVGDVGRFEIDADVKPRDVEAGGVFSVTIHVKGDGRPPASIRMPTIAGIEWLDPERDVEHVTRGGRVGGVRTFRYLAKVSTSGFVQLGSIELPHWDPEKATYVTAKADLGGVRIAGDAQPAPSASASPADGDDGLASLPPARSELRPFTRPPDTSVPLLPLLAALAAPPLLVMLGFAGASASRSARRRAAERRDAPTTRVREALDAARAADVDGDARAVAAGVERAIHAAIEAHTGLRSRGVMIGSLPAELATKGVPPDLATRLTTLLRDAESLRFDPVADAAGRTALVTSARAVLKELASSSPAIMMKSLRKARFTPLLVIVVLAASAAEPRAAEVDDTFARAAAALEAGRADEAIATLEAMANRGVVHPDASFQRGLSYARRAAGASPQPGDLGHAAAGFEEALRLRPADAEAAAALELVRGEVARRRSRRGKDQVVVGDPPDRLVVGLASERTWAALALVSSLVLGLGLILRRRPSGPLRVAGVLGVPLGALGLLAFAPAAWWAGVLERQRAVGVVVQPDVVITDAAGARTDAPDLPEGARVEIPAGGEASFAERRPIRWGSYEGWVPATAVRRLAR